MLNFFLLRIYKSVIGVILINSVCMAYAVNTTTIINILSLLENKKYFIAARIMEQQITQSNSKQQKGYYALLLNQLPARIILKKKRYEYAFIAARLVKDLPKEKRLFLWLEAADGFFRVGNLRKANYCYKQTLLYLNNTQSEWVYVLYKQAWIYINQKKWHKSLNLFTKALVQKNNNLRDNILIDIGKIWAENHFIKKSMHFEKLNQIIRTVSVAEQQLIVKGVAQGIQRMGTNNINKVILALLKHPDFSARVLNQILSKQVTNIDNSCYLIHWIYNTDIKLLDNHKVLTILNSCTHFLKVTKDKSILKKQQLKKIVTLYTKIKKTGVERWPLIFIYESLNKKTEACNESLHQLKETIQNMDKKTLTKQIHKTLLISLRLCKKTKASTVLVKQVIDTVFKSDEFLKRYSIITNSLENTLLHILKTKSFFTVLQNRLFTFKKPWYRKDLFPILLLSDIKKYPAHIVKEFLNRFGDVPINGYYLDILLAKNNFFTTQDLQRWLPISDINSYRQSIPWLKKALIHKVNDSQKQEIVNKLLEYFPKKNTKQASVFLALHYLKTNQLSKIFEHWNHLSSVFFKKTLAVELFDAILHSTNNTCTKLHTIFSVKQIKDSSFLKFTSRCCKIRDSKKITVRKLKIHYLLNASVTAWDFVLLIHIKQKTRLLKKRISHLNKYTSSMISNLKKSISKYKKRKWRLSVVGNKVGFLLNQQINIFEAELLRLAKNSPYEEQYKQLQNLIIQWR